MDVGRLRPGEMIAAVSGTALFGFMFLDWFAFGASYIAKPPLGADITPGGTLNAWKSFDLIDIVLLITAAAALALAVSTATSMRLSLPVAPSVVIATLGILSTVLVLFRVLAPIGEPAYDREAGIWLGLLAAAGVALGGHLSMQHEGMTFSAEADRLRALRGQKGPRPPAT